MKAIYHIKNTWKKIADAKKANSKKYNQDELLYQINKIDDFLTKQIVDVMNETAFDKEEQYEIFADIKRMQKEIRMVENEIREEKPGAYRALREFILKERIECCQKYYIPIISWHLHLEKLSKCYKAITVQQKTTIKEKKVYSFVY